MLNKLATFLYEKGFIFEAFAAAELGHNKKILILIHPDSIFEKVLGQGADVAELNSFIRNIKERVSSGEYEEVFTELFYSPSFKLSEHYSSDNLDEIFKEFVDYLKSNTVSFYRYETKSTSLSGNKLFDLLSDYIKKDYLFCFGGGYRELCLKDAINAFEYYSRYKESMKESNIIF